MSSTPLCETHHRAPSWDSDQRTLNELLLSTTPPQETDFSERAKEVTLLVLQILLFAVAAGAIACAAIYLGRTIGPWKTACIAALVVAPLIIAAIGVFQCSKIGAPKATAPTLLETDIPDL